MLNTSTHRTLLAVLAMVASTPCSSFLTSETIRTTRSYDYDVQRSFLPNRKKTPNNSNLFMSNNNPIDDESEEERQARMDLVRQLQKSFYQDEIECTNAPSKGSTIMEDLPLWRTQWTELPGFQNVLNVHVPHYTNMFQKILRSDSKTKYFGHLYLPGGSENLDNPEYKLEEGSKASLTGVLMKISSYEELDDGRLVLVVQALEKFRVVEAKRHHSPYSIATVEIIPDEELVKGQILSEEDCEGILDDENIRSAAAVAEAFDWHDFEFLQVTDCIIPRTDEDEEVAVSPLVNYNIEFSKEEKDIVPIASKTLVQDSLLEKEYKVWVLIDEMIHLLQSFVDPRKEKPTPIPTQILGLLPTNPIHPWPETFSLEKFALKLETENTFIGTFTKSQFTRVDNHNVEYSPIRRATRLSFIIWALTDTIVLPDNGNFDCSRQNILEVDSVEKRLDVGLKKLQLICLMIRNVLNQNRF
jgi:Lon protease-like protein